jgi:hypothetical protein
MALSFQDELQGFLRHKLEQDPPFHRAMTEGRWEVPVEEGLRTVVRMFGAYNEAFLLVAQEIDKLRAAVDSG